MNRKSKAEVYEYNYLLISFLTNGISNEWLSN
jgi:hypothetical protein